MFDHEKVILCFLVCLLFVSADSADTITQNAPLRDGDVLVSQRKTFVLGFFSPTNSTSNRYVGIWYSNVSIQTVVWILNRDNPINGTSGILSVTENGNLALLNQSLDRPIWSTNISETERSNSSFAQLLDTGNFVFYNDSSNNFVAWQGFDYPTNTMLPDMKIGFDRRTGLNRSLTSWKSAVDPGTGDFTFSMDISGSPQEFLRRGSTVIWRTGPWNGIRWSGVPRMKRGTNIFNTSFRNDNDEISVVNSVTDNTVFSVMMLNESGMLQRQTWFENQGHWFRFWYVPRELCDNFGICGAFGNCDPSNNTGFQCACLPGYEPRSARDWNLRDGSGGCVRKRSVQGCGNGDGFVRVEGVRVPDTSASRATHVDLSMGIEACEEFCWRNCTCVGYTSNDISGGGSGTGCISWHGEIWDVSLMLNGDQDLYIRVDATELALYARNKKRSNIQRIVEVILPLTVAAVFFLFLVYWMVKKKRKGERDQDDKLFFGSKASPAGEGADESSANTDLQFYSLSSVVAATENFSINNKLGEGGFGSVYKGQLRNGQEVAIKRLSDNSGQGIEEFKNEVTLIAKLQHRNLVRLLGYCVTKEEKVLIYEYMPNKGLDSFIFDKEKGALVSWRKRFEITLGISRGMLYLHQDSRLRIIHRDLKASNVLLDESMNPKISDFGMARIFGAEQIEAITERVVGTYGYMSPEYAMEGLFSIKSDVFSFGVLLLEIISGRKSSSYYNENSSNLIGYVWDLWGEGSELEIIDPSLRETYEENEVKRCIHIGLLCVQESATDRPSMSEVAFMLCHDVSLPSPKQSAFITKGGDFRHISSSASAGTFSVSDDPITTVVGR